MSDQEELNDNRTFLLNLLFQPVINFSLDIGLSSTGQWMSPESPGFSSCEYFIQKSRGLKIQVMEWKSKTAIICLASRRSQDEEVRISFDMLKKLGQLIDISA
jgi:hypothetical protein